MFYTVQAVSRKITQILIENHLDSMRKIIQSLKFQKLRSKVKNVLKKSVPAHTELMKIVKNCGKSDILRKGKQVVSLVKRFSNKFFQCLQSSPPASTHSLQLPFVFWCTEVSLVGPWDNCRYSTQGKVSKWHVCKNMIFKLYIFL